jgi:hypothetical protein
MQPFTQSSPIPGGAGVKVGSGVGVSGAGVEVESPTGTVSVGTGVGAVVDVEMETTSVGGMGVSRGVNMFNAVGRSAMQIPPTTVIIAARMDESIDFFDCDLSLSLDISASINQKFSILSDILPVLKDYHRIIIFAICRSILPMG